MSAPGRSASRSRVARSPARRWRCGRGSLEADALARLEPRLREVHPEVSFAAMAGRPLAHPKWTWGGMLLRMALLEQAGIVIPADIADAGSAGIDDVLDAAAAAWSATRLARGGAGSLPADSRQGPDGHVAAIWY